MKEQFVTFDIALKLKELGFDELCICGYNSYKTLKSNIGITYGDLDDLLWDNKYDSKLPAPLWQQAIDWLRTNFMITINIADNAFERKYAYAIGYLFSNSIMDLSGPYLNLDNAGKYYDTYEKAREAAILKALEILLNKKSKSK